MGVDCDVPTLARMARVTERGTSLAALGGAAREIGLGARAYRIRSPKYLCRLRKDAYAIVLLREEDHFVLVWPAQTRERLCLARFPEPLKEIHYSDLENLTDSRILVVSRADGPRPLQSLVVPRVALLTLASIAVVSGLLLLRTRIRQGKKPGQA
ncbi:hypothetical protein JW916_04160 [Candidatus Sumerlaeota bacterium]|nr:hypothetical protein [Candidatus Sumerlaeota bacterium]